MKIAIFAAFPHELKHIKRRLGIRGDNSNYPVDISFVHRASQEIIIARTGMGTASASAALDVVVNRYRPDFILSLGFCGALYEGAAPGDLVWASNIFLVSALSLPFDQWPSLSITIPADFTGGRFPRRLVVREGTLFTLADWTRKSELRTMVGGMPFPVCDMETYALAEISIERGLKFLAVRAVTDVVGQEIPKKLFGVTDEVGNYSLSRALGILLRNPHLIPSAARLGVNSNKASRSLCRFVELLAGDEG